MMKIINGSTYSRDLFYPYEYRLKVRIFTENKTFDVDIYTDESKIEKIKEDLKRIISPKAEWHRVVDWITTEQDRADKELVNELLDSI